MTHQCKNCKWLNYDYFEGNLKYYAELLGVDAICGKVNKPIKIQIDQDNNSNCGFEPKEKVAVKQKAKCKDCYYLNYDFLHKKHEQGNGNFCGLHGRAPVDIDGEQPNFNQKGGCYFSPKKETQPVQLTLF